MNTKAKDSQAAYREGRSLQLSAPRLVKPKTNTLGSLYWCIPALLPGIGLLRRRSGANGRRKVSAGSRDFETAGAIVWTSHTPWSNSTYFSLDPTHWSLSMHVGSLIFVDLYRLLLPRRIARFPDYHASLHLALSCCQYGRTNSAQGIQ